MNLVRLLTALLSFIAISGIAQAQGLKDALPAATPSATPAAGKPSSGRMELLDPREAFAISVMAKDAKTVTVQFKIAPGYYMYRDHFRFAVVEPKSAKLGRAVIPLGIKKYDETFRKTLSTHRDAVAISLPVSGATEKLTLKVTSQGCADVGVCYPPEEAIVTVVFKADAAKAAPDKANQADAAKKSVSGGSSGITTRGAWIRVATLADLELVLSRLERTKRLAMLDFYADWCAPCVQMERQTFSDAQVKEALLPVIQIQMDVTKNTPEHKAVMKKYFVLGPPAMLFFATDGKEIRGSRLMGFQPPPKFLERLALVKG